MGQCLSSSAVPHQLGTPEGGGAETSSLGRLLLPAPATAATEAVDDTAAAAGLLLGVESPGDFVLSLLEDEEEDGADDRSSCYPGFAASRQGSQVT